MAATYAGWDCHTHIFGPYDQYPLADGRTYSPPPASTTDLLAHLDTVGLPNVVLVQPNSHGTDTRAMMSALATLGNRARAVTVIDTEHTSADELAGLKQAGVRGARLNIHTAGTPEPTDSAAAFDHNVRILQDSGLHLQLFATGTVLLELIPRIASAGRSIAGHDLQVVVDHMGMAIHGGGDGLEVARQLADSGCWIKLSAPERMGVNPTDPRVQALVAEYASRAPDRILWGSDWPHSALVHDRPIAQTEPFRPVDDDARLVTMRSWLGESLLERMLVTNPRTLYH